MAKVAFYIGTNSNIWKAIQQWAIRIWTLGAYSHCELIDDHGSENPDKWTWYAATTYKPGVTCARRVKYNKDKWVIYDLPDGIDYKPALDYMTSNLGLKYDWLGIWFSQAIPLNIQDKSKAFCSEFNMAALQRTILLDGDNRKPQSYSPNGMYRKLKKIGALTKWQK